VIDDSASADVEITRDNRELINGRVHSKIDHPTANCSLLVIVLWLARRNVYKESIDSSTS